MRAETSIERPYGKVYRVRPTWMRRGTAAATAAVLLLVALYAGYAQRVGWIGINGRTATLWAWMKLLLLPLAFAVVPVAHEMRGRVNSPNVIVAMPVGLVGAAFIAAGYLVPLRWTGFAGKALWDWLHLTLPPAAVASLPLLPRSTVRWKVGFWVGAMGVFAAIAVASLGGYLWGWTWTGFAGNTLWDWLELLLLPATVPLVLGPGLAALARRDSSRVGPPPARTRRVPRARRASLFS